MDHQTFDTQDNIFGITPVTSIFAESPGANYFKHQDAYHS